MVLDRLIIAQLMGFSAILGFVSWTVVSCYTISMTTISPWINFNGNAEAAFTFYQSVFGGDFSKIIRFGDLTLPEFPVDEKEVSKIMQIVLPISSDTVLIGNDVPAYMGTVHENENRSKICIDVDSREEAERIFNGLSVRGQVEVPFGPSPWGTQLAMFRDVYGVEWVIEYRPLQV